MSKQVKVPDEVHAALMGARMEGETAADVIARLLEYGERLAATTVQVDEADILVDKLDYQNEHPESTLSDEDRALLASLAPGELPPCCQEIFDDPEHPTPTCKHWRQAYENYYGQRMWGYVNDLVGGGYRTWFNKYVK